MCSTKEMYHYEVSEKSQMNGRTASTAWFPEAAVLPNLIIYDMQLKHQNIQKRWGTFDKSLEAVYANQSESYLISCLHHSWFLRLPSCRTGPWFDIRSRSVFGGRIQVLTWKGDIWICTFLGVWKFGLWFNSKEYWLVQDQDELAKENQTMTVTVDVSSFFAQFKPVVTCRANTT